MPLTVLEIEKLKPKDKPYKKSDGHSLYLLVTPKGAKLWRWKYRIMGREKLLSIGAYGKDDEGQISLKRAREICSDAYEQFKKGIDPSISKKLEGYGLDRCTFQGISLYTSQSSAHSLAI